MTLVSHDGRRGAGVLALATLVFGVGAVGGWWLLTAPMGSDGRYTCTPQTVRSGERLPSSLVAVHVLNGGSTEGMAGRVSTDLQARGFRPGSIANSLSSVKPAAVTILATAESDPQVQLVAAQFQRVDYRKPDIAVASGVTVVIGDEFAGLRPGAPTSIEVATDVTVCF